MLKEETLVLACPDEICDFESIYKNEVYCGKCSDKKLLMIKCPHCNGLINKRDIVTCTLCGESLLVETFDFSSMKSWEGI